MTTPHTTTAQLADYCRQLEAIIDEHVNLADVAPRHAAIVAAIQQASDARRSGPRKAGDAAAIPLLK